MKKLLSISIATLLFLVSCGSNSTVDIINPDADFLYFYGATCPHCQDLNKQIEELDLLNKVSIEKREVYYNNGNRWLFLETAKKAGLKEDDVWVPFVYDKATGEHAVWVWPALELFNTRVDSVANDIINEVTSSWTTE